MARRTQQRFRCFSCGHDVPRHVVRKRGRRKDGSRWYLCQDCSEAYKLSRLMLEEQAERSDRVLTDSGKVVLGWNGVPSEAALKRRRS